ncbi:MAG: carboxymuconolactone decarboxylase family protein [Bacteroidota bacterium]|uniref:Carboxymuconolactone decarboxylase family protein n=1 Tax=Flagellimonas okinawensis TaxID=3031324 RepID=A0ABT5XJ91_9FLAO|nr:carboxymuconolactone decarboxylase family protein [[Muricauda] okinawensis]MDF0705746.1 carboxymuconolactone decarboxylase family protein [[Muricauda] okinawensis]MEC8832428.1 carboxymuconolactone decarboxylase family protein [Bacteroidota bacterium]
MTRLQALDPKEATGRSKELFDGIQAKLGMVPNMMKTMGNSSVVLEGYLNLSELLGKGSLGGKLGELLALTVAEANACNYCLSAHSFIGEKLVGIDTNTLQSAREAINADPKIAAALQFAKSLINKNGRVTAEDVETVKAAGYSDGAVGEIVAHVALNVFTNYFNNTANTDIDFPVVEVATV